MQQAENIRGPINPKPTFVLKLLAAESRVIAGHSINTKPQSSEITDGSERVKLHRTLSMKNKNKLNGATAHKGQALLCPSQYTRSLGAEVHEQMPRSCVQSEAKHTLFSPKASLVAIYRPNEEMKGCIDLCPTRGSNPDPVVWKRRALPLSLVYSATDLKWSGVIFQGFSSLSTIFRTFMINQILQMVQLP
ncbi:hypothetical protein TNCV_4433721 [Trichonephila clavipes]|nr:hypothetical protein TNCV_4433721 [Trichonephila clavipes]